MTGVDFEGIQVGDRVRVTYEFDVEDVQYNHQWVDSSGSTFYPDDDLVSVEKVLILPTKDGWYESAVEPISGGNNRPYRLVNGLWSFGDCGLTPSDMLDKMPLTLLGTQK